MNLVDNGLDLLPEDMPLAVGVRVLASHPSGLLALEKPVAMRSHSNREEFVDQGALLACPYDFAEEAYRWADGSGSQQWLYLTH